jgi:hypothetical protein
MKFLDFFKKREREKTDIFSELSNRIFPKGKKDINAGTQELLDILNHEIEEETARMIFLKSTALSRLAKNFDIERLRIHLSGYCIQYFDEQRLNRYFDYLNALTIAMVVNRRTPSEVRRVGNLYVW